MPLRSWYRSDHYPEADGLGTKLPVSGKYLLHLGLSLGLTCAGVGLAGPVLAQPSPVEVESVPLNEISPASELPANGAVNTAPGYDSAVDEVTTPASPSPNPAPELVNLTLPELLTLTLEGNRSLRNDTLDRIVQRQQLNEAEQAFDPRFTPIFSVGVTQQLSSNGGFTVQTDQGLTLITDSTDFNSGAALETTLNTRQGTELSLGLDPLDSTQPFQFTIRQPLLQGFGTAVNEAPVEQARIAESQNQLDLRQAVISTMTTAITQYTSLIAAQEAVTIQADALNRRRQQLEILQALVAAGRRAQADLYDTERTVADAERDLIVAQNQLIQVNTGLLNLVGTDRNLQFVAATATVNDLFAAAVATVPSYEAETLVQTAYQRRPDYLQAQLQQRNLELNQLVAQDNQRWRLNAEVDGNLGDFSQTNLGLVATRTFDDPSLETERVSSDVQLQQQANRLDQLREQIRNDVISGLIDVQSNLTRVEAAERATQSAQRQLDALQEQFRRGVNNVDLFEIINQEEALVSAQNNALVSRIAFLDSIATLEQTVGITVERWSSQVNLSPVLSDIDPLPGSN